MTDVLELLDSVNIAATHDKLGLPFIFQPDFVLAAKPLHHLTNVLDVYNGRAVNADKASVVEFFF